MIQPAFAIQAFAFGPHFLVATDVAAPVQNLVGQAEDFVQTAGEELKLQMGGRILKSPFDQINVPQARRARQFAIGQQLERPRFQHNAGRDRQSGKLIILIFG